MNQKETYLSFILLTIAFMILLITLYPYQSNPQKTSFPQISVPNFKGADL